MSIRAVIFDMDGTLTRPYLDFPAIRVAIKMAAPATKFVVKSTK